jgi:hypothetical protein
MALVVAAWGIDRIELGSRSLAQPLVNRTLSLGQCELARTRPLGLKFSLVFSTLSRSVRSLALSRALSRSLALSRALSLALARAPPIYLCLGRETHNSE